MRGKEEEGEEGEEDYEEEDDEEDDEEERGEDEEKEVRKTRNLYQLEVVPECHARIKPKNSKPTLEYDPPVPGSNSAVLLVDAMKSNGE